MPFFGGPEAGDFADESVEVEDREVGGAGDDDDYDEKELVGICRLCSVGTVEGEGGKR